MNAEARFILAVVLMLMVLVGGNVLFPPQRTEVIDGPASAEMAESASDLPSIGVAPPSTESAPSVGGPPSSQAPSLPGVTPAESLPTVVELPGLVEAEVLIEGPLYRFTLSNRGARVRSAELVRFPSFTREGGVELVASAALGMLGNRMVIEADTVDLRELLFSVSPEGGLRLTEGGMPQTITFRYEHPREPFAFEVAYTFDPATYLVHVRGRSEGLPRGLLITDLGEGIALNEVDEGIEVRNLAYVVNHLQGGVRSTEFGKVASRVVEDGPFHWVAVRSQYFVVGVLPREQAGSPEYLGGVLAGAVEGGRAAVAVTQSLGSGGTFEYRLYAGPQDYALLSALGEDFQEVNPVGWSFLRPVLRPIVAVIMWVLLYLHQTLAVSYGWVLILVGILMRIVLFPLNHKAMRAQLRNMAVQPLLKDIQTKYKDQPEKMQKELMKLYKEHGFNPLAGCWPMLLPWPVLIALFFVFQNTIELRGVPFAWLPDLSSKDPFFILPVLLGASMFLLQWISMRAMSEVNAQMKMMLWMLPIFMVVLFATLPSGLNLYYLTANLATLPQSWWIARERQKVQPVGTGAPVKR